MSRISAEAKATGLAAEEVHHHTGLVLLEKEEAETNGFQTVETRIEERTLTPTYHQQVGELKDHELVLPLPLAFADDRAAPSVEAEMTLILTGHDLHHVDFLPDGMTDPRPLQGGALDLRMVADLLVLQSKDLATILYRIPVDLPLLQSGKDFPHLTADNLIVLVLLEDRTRHHLVMWGPEGIEQDLGHRQGVTSEERFTMTIIGDVDPHHPEPHHLLLSLALRQDLLLLQFILIV